MTGAGRFLKEKNPEIKVRFFVSGAMENKSGIERVDKRGRKSGNVLFPFCLDF